MNQNVPDASAIATPPKPGTPTGGQTNGDDQQQSVKKPPAKVDDSSRAPGFVLFGAFAWLVLLAATFFVYLMSSDFRNLFPDSIGVVPIEVIWFGAVGGLLKSYSGIFHYHRNDRQNSQWLDRFNLWHLLRPPISAITGGISCLLFVVLIRTAGGSFDGATGDDATFFAVAFVFGYAESAFRAQVKAVTDALVRPGDTAADSPR